jgi:PKD repeat protein
VNVTRVTARALLATLPVLLALVSPGVAMAAPPPPPLVSLTVTPNPVGRGDKVTAEVTIDRSLDPASIRWAVDGKAPTKFDGHPVLTGAFSTLGNHVIAVKAGAESPVQQTVVVVNRPPVAAIAVDDANPFTGEELALSSAASDADHDPLTCTWDLDSDGTFETPGCAANQTYAKAGTFTVGLRVSDGTATDIATKAITVANRLPVPSFSVAPGAPLTGASVSFDSGASSDADGTIVARAWDLDNDGAFDDGSSPTASFAFATAGAHTVRLQVVDDNGAAAIATVDVEVAQAPPAIAGAAPKPAVAPLQPLAATLRYAFNRTAGSATFTSLVVRHLPVGAAVKATCKGGGCAKRAFTAVAKSDSVSLKPLTGRRLKAGAVITVKITKAGTTGRTITLTVRKGKDPKVT